MTLYPIIHRKLYSSGNLELIFIYVILLLILLFVFIVYKYAIKHNLSLFAILKKLLSWIILFLFIVSLAITILSLLYSQ